PLAKYLIPVISRRQGVAPVTERAIRELHDVALVHERHTLALVGKVVVDGSSDQALRALSRNGLDADTAGLREADLRHSHFLLQELDDLLHLGRTRLPLDACIDVFRVLTEDHDVDLVGFTHRTRHPREPAHGPQTYVKIELLA